MRAWRCAAIALLLSACSPPQQDANVVIVHVGAGNWADANVEAYVEPFEKETGIKVVRFADDVPTSKLRLMHDSDSVQVDVISMPAMYAARAAQLALLSDIDYSLYKPEELAGMSEEVRKPWGVAALYYAIVIGWNGRQLSGADRPRGWQDFWDTTKFPGARTLITGQYGDGPWEEALLADGVPPDEIYPIDIDRVFRSLERIRPHTVKWWRVGSEGQQVMRDSMASVGAIFDGRIADIATTRKDVGFTYEQGKRLLDYWVIPAKAPNRANAQRFIEFAMRGRQQAIFAQRVAYGPSNSNAFQHIPEEVARTLPSHPDNLAKMFEVDVEWYTAKDETGVANIDRMIQRWYAWVLQ